MILASAPAVIVLGLVGLTLFYSNPNKLLTHHPQAETRLSLTVALPVLEVREKIIRLLDPSSSLVEQPTPEQRQAQENAELDARNQENLKCLAVKSSDTQQKTKCARLVEVNMVQVLQPAPSAAGSKQSDFHFSVKAGSELRRGYDGDEPYNYNLRGLVFLYERRGFERVDTVLRNYLAQEEKVRESDLWLSEDAIGMSMDDSRSSSLKEQELEKFYPTDEYTYQGKPVLGTSDYIVELRSLDATTTEITIKPLFPRVLAGSRFETSCHAFYCPRFVYDLQPVEKYDVERTALKEYLSDNLR